MSDRYFEIIRQHSRPLEPIPSTKLSVVGTGDTTEEAAKLCFNRLAHKMPVRCRLVKRRPI